MSLLGSPAVRCHRIARWSRGVWAITAYEELVELGHLDAAGLQLLFELARQEAHRFPSLAPREGWTADALWDLAHDFFVDRGARVTTMLLAQASDEASMGRLLRRSLRRSEERRVGKECRSPWSPYHQKKKPYVETNRSGGGMTKNEIEDLIKNTMAS